MDGARNHAGGGPVWLEPDAGSIDDFSILVSRRTDPADWPAAAAVEHNIPIYDGAAVRRACATPQTRRAFMAEWARIFRDGPGVLAIRDAVDREAVDRATLLFERLIGEERESGAGGGDHFAKPGANDRVWNAAQKHCLADPEGFAAYYASDAIAAASEAWLGPNYQLTAQVNRVNPGGAAQTPHRDYHLGFMTLEDAVSYPAQCHAMSPLLTLQGAVAHCDMPLDSGPTMLLPYSQAFFEGYVAFHHEAYREVFARHHVQLPLQTGDAMFFNPALMHGAGTNRSPDIRRMANLLQVGSAFGRSIETVDREAMVAALYPVLAGRALSGRARENVIAASAEGYAYPTNLDRDPPAPGSLAPLSPAQIMRAALAEGKSAEAFVAEIRAAAERRRA
ncbi:phytanoyl-CoA dioxygenase family protein [Ovoidimarina sediminis]|uniref:phytanoyl-CoA dioxygenase family protein n=1 Tax=Ovoidimarina sediminis TaxID=3079856 RepID=UPI0029082810|nr:phytanoyl-CoA dioxygenase family protein [Rhodophyticola sp. MJ-SS7]MDU8945190.1 phytanoyl-CoA dioxygenase family protein [Rhodophyticola sp. MJ-SS7]